MGRNSGRTAGGQRFVTVIGTSSKVELPGRLMSSGSMK